MLKVHKVEVIIKSKYHLIHIDPPNFRPKLQVFSNINTQEFFKLCI